MMKILCRSPLYLRSRWQKRVQEIRADGRDPNLEDLKKMIRGAAKEKNDPVFSSSLDPAKDDCVKQGGIKKQATGSQEDQKLCRFNHVSRWFCTN